MRFLKQPFLLLIVLMGGIGFMVFELSRPSAALRTPPTPLFPSETLAPADLVVQLEGLRAEKAASLTKVASLEAEVRQLKKELAVRTQNGGEHAQKQQASAQAGGDRVTGASEETPFSKSVLELAVKAGRLNAQIQLHPELDIPELQYVDEGEWIHFAKEADLDSAEGISKALAELRKSAKSRFADLAREALSSYAKANSGQAPASLSQLAPYLPDSMTASLLDRYQLVPANSPQKPASAEIGGPMILREKAVVDPQYDTSFDIGPTGWTSTSTGTGYIRKQFR